MNKNELYQIYLITNLANGKEYVGQVDKSRGYLKRFHEHIAKARNSSQKCKLHSAINHYGAECFSICLLEDNVQISDVDSAEIFWIKKLGTYNSDYGYNMTEGGQGIHGFHHSEGTKERLSVSSKNAWEKLREDESRYEIVMQRKRDALSGRTLSEDHKHKLSVSASKRVGNKNSFYGKHHTDETKKKISENNSKPVCMIDLISKDVIRKFSSAAEACKFLLENGITSNKNAYARILKICHGHDKSAYGYMWKFI